MNVATGELAALASAGCWAIATILFARLGTEIAPLTLNTLKCGIACLLLSLTVLALGGMPASWPSASVGWLLLSGLIGLTLGDTFLFAAINRIGPRKALLITISAAPLTAVAAIPILGEWLSVLAWLGIGLTVSGVLWVIAERSASRGTQADRAGLLFAVAAAVCQAGGNLTTKLGAEDVMPLKMATWRLAAATLGLLMMLGARGQLLSIANALRQQLRARKIVTATLIGTYFGVWLQVAGIAGTETGIAATLSSTSPILVLPLARFWLGELISWRAIAGACAAVCGIALLFA